MQNPKPLVYRQEPGAISNLLTLQPTDDSQMQSSNKFVVSRAPMLTQTTSEPATNSASYVTNCQPTYASVLKNMLANTKQTKGTQTNKTDPMTTEKLKWFGPPASISQPPVFPTNSYCVHYPRLLAPSEQLNFALYPPMCFCNNIWEMMWQGGSLVLDVMNVPRCLGVRVRSAGNSELGPRSIPRSKMSMGQRAWLQHGCCAPMGC